MMLQFACWKWGGKRWLWRIDPTAAYDFYVGFYRPIKALED